MPLDKHYQQARDSKKMFRRVLSFRADMIESNDDRTVPVVFSSDEWTRMYYGEEKLLHGAENVDLSYFNDRVSPLLVEHTYHSDAQVGVIETASVDGTKGNATIRFGRGEKASEYYHDVLDGIRTSLSVGYEIRAWSVDDSDPDKPKFTVTEWIPREISLVAFPADDNAGVIRAERKKDFMLNDNVPEREDLAMAEQTTAVAVAPTAVAPTAAAFEIYDRGKTENEQSLAMETINNGGSLEDFEKALLEKRNLLAKEKETSPEEEREERDANRFRISDLIFQMLNPDSERGKQSLIEAKDLTSDAEKKGFVRHGANSVILPFSRLDGMDESKARLQKRDITSAAASGGHLIGEEVRGDIFVWALRNKMVLGDMVTMLTGLRGDVSIPAETTEPTAAWVAENTAPTESDPVIGQIALTPHHARGYVEISNTLIAQSSVDVEMVIRESLVKAIALIVDKAILTGSGTSNQPSGIDNIPSLSTTTYATALSNATLANIIAVETALDTANAPDMNRAFVAAPDVRAKYRTVPIGTGGVPAWYMGMLLDSPAYVTNQAPSGELYYGSWKEAYCGLWDAITIQVNPYSLDTSGLTRVVASQFADVAFAHGGSFAKLEMA